MLYSGALSSVCREKSRIWKLEMVGVVHMAIMRYQVDAYANSVLLCVM